MKPSSAPAVARVSHQTDAERLRAYILTLPHVAETMQWGANLVFWCCPKSLGGKMFAVINLDEPTPAELSGRKLRPVASFAAGPAAFAELVEREDIVPAPYLARAHWVAALDWNAFTPAEWQQRLAAAHAVVLAKVPARSRAALASSSHAPAPARKKPVKP
jgi:predicted DNA-binding protein (MmcQ/YjbR family)